MKTHVFQLLKSVAKNLEMMELIEEFNEFTPERLEMCTYRYLQQISKKMGLPSNVKKIQLIDLIRAKKSRTPEEVENIIHRVKLERQRLSQAKKNRKIRKKIKQCTEISSTSQSPPITMTPKRRLAIRYSPEDQIVRYKPKPTILDLNKTLIRKTYPSPKKTIGSDRVLRSFNVKASNYGIMNSVIGVIKAPNSTANQETRINIIGQDGRTQRLNVTAIVRKRPLMSNSLALRNERPMQVSRTMISNPIKRQRAISGIYPLQEIPKPIQYMKSVVHRQDGRQSQYNMNTQNPNYHFKNDDYHTDVTVQDLIDSNVNQSIINDDYNFHGENDLSKDETCSVYYHKKIRSEQMKSQEQRDCDWALPKINEVFSQFNNVRRSDLCQPLYVKVSEEPERLLNYPTLTVNANLNNTTMIESLYNFKNQFILNHPLLQVATTTNTRCVFSTPTIATPMAQPSHTVVSNEYYQSLCERDSQRQYRTDIEITPRTYDYSRFSEQEMALRRDFRCNEVMSTSSSSLETCVDSSQELGANVTIPEMVEDALELISQDGDYMERIGMDLRMQCVLCSWAGPRIILEYHIRKDHPNEIQAPNTNECNITFTVGRLVEQQLWLSQVVEYDSVLYALSAKYEDPDCLMLNVAMISQDTITPKYAKITIYNKVTGEPHTWQGEIQQISPLMPYENQTNCLKLELSKLDLLPNSANLKLLNRQLVLKSPVKVIVGQPELDSIHLVVFLRLLNYL